jgi:hypothetical protein
MTAPLDLQALEAARAQDIDDLRSLCRDYIFTVGEQGALVRVLDERETLIARVRELEASHGAYVVRDLLATIAQLRADHEQDNEWLAEANAENTRLRTDLAALQASSARDEIKARAFDAITEWPPTDGDEFRARAVRIYRVAGAELAKLAALSKIQHSTRPLRPMSRATAGGFEGRQANARAFHSGEVACKCGFVVCSKLGPCAPLKTPREIFGDKLIDHHVFAPYMPKVAAPPEAAHMPRFKVGDRVLYPHGAFAGLVGTVARVDAPFYAAKFALPGKEASNYAFHDIGLEPAPAPPPGWAPRDGDAYQHLASGYWIRAHEGEWVSSAAPGRWPSLALACCAALGIEVAEVRGDARVNGWNARGPGTGGYTGNRRTADACARAALEAYERGRA